MKTNVKNLIIIAALAVFVFNPREVLALNNCTSTTSFHWIGASGASWTTTGSWAKTQGGTACTSGYPNGTNVDVAFDCTNPTTITVVMPSGTISVKGITFGSDTVTFQGNAGGSTLSVNNTSSTAYGPTFDTNMTLSIDAGTFTNTASTTLTINKTMTIASGATYTGSGNLTLGASGAVTNNGTSTTISAFGSATGTWTQGASSALTYSGNGTNFPATFTANAAGNTVTFTGSGNIPAVTYTNLTINHSSTNFSLTGTTAATVLTITAGTLAAGTNNLTVSTTLSNSGLITVSTGTLSIPNASVGNFTFTDTNNIPAATYGTLTINASGKVATLAGTVAATTLTLTAGTLDVNSRSFTVSTTLSNSDLITVSTGTLSIPNASVGNFTFTDTNNIPAATYGTLTINASGKTGTLTGTVVTSTLTITNGTLSVNSRSFTVSSTLSNSGLITVSTGTLSIPNASVGNFTFTDTNNIPAATYGTLTINASGKIATLAGTVAVGGLTVTDGTFELSNKDFTNNGTSSITGILDDGSAQGTNVFVGKVTINSGGAWTTANNPPFEFRGGLERTGTGTFTSGTGIYTFSTNAQTVDQTDSNDFTITNLTNTITAGNGLTFSGSHPTVTTLTQGTSAVLTFSGAMPAITTLTATASGNTVQYTNSLAGQTVKGTTYANLVINNPLQVAALGDNVVVAAITVTAGTLDGNGKTVSTGSLLSSNSNNRGITLGTGAWSLTGTGTIWDTSTATNLTLISSGSSITIVDTSSSAKTFSGGGKTFNNFTVSGGASAGALTIAGSNTFATLTLNADSHTTFTNGTTTTLTNLVSNGTASHLAVIDSDSAGSAASLTTASSQISTDYLSVKDSTPVQENVWYAGANSTRVGTNTGNWLFSAPACIRYWVGGGSSTNWSATGNTNWAAASGGSNNASVPDSSCDVIFNGVGASANGASTISAGISVKSLTITAGYTNTLTHNAGVTLTIAGDTYQLGSDMTYTLGNAGTSATNFTSTTGTSGSPTQITTNGKTLGNATFNGSGGYFQLNGNFTANTITQTNGTILANTTLTLSSTSTGSDFTIASGGILKNSGADATLTLSSGKAIVVNSAINSTSNKLNLVFNADSASIAAGVSSNAGSITFAPLTAGATIGLAGGTGTLSLSATSLGYLTYGSLTIGSTDDTGAMDIGAYSGWGGPVSFLVGNSGSIAVNGTQSSNYAFSFAGPAALNANISSSALTIAGAFNAGSSTITLSGISGVFSCSAGDFTAGSSTIRLTDSSSNSATFAGGGNIFNDLYFKGAATTKTYTITGANTFHDIKDDGTAVHAIIFPNTTTTVSTFSVNGSDAGHRISLQRTGGSGKWTISASPGTISVSNCSISNSIATGASWQAYTTNENLNGGGNTGWLFYAPGVKTLRIKGTGRMSGSGIIK